MVVTRSLEGYLYYSYCPWIFVFGRNSSWKKTCSLNMRSFFSTRLKNPIYYIKWLPASIHRVHGLPVQLTGLWLWESVICVWTLRRPGFSAYNSETFLRYCATLSSLFWKISPQKPEFSSVFAFLVSFNKNLSKLKLWAILRGANWLPEKLKKIKNTEISKLFLAKKFVIKMLE